VLGGGRYDGLAASLGSKVHSPGIGFSIGEDRLVMSVEGEQTALPLDLFIAPLGEPALRHAAVMAREFRRAGRSVELVEAKLKRAMELANKLGARFTLIVGENEMAAGRYALKDMGTGEQQELTRDEIEARLNAASN
jgi:histidyl-tRNA synthetase